MSLLCEATPGHLAFLWPRRHIMAARFARSPPWPRSLLIPQTGKSTFGNDVKPCVRPPRSRGKVSVPALCRPSSPQPSARNFNRSIPTSSTRRSRHFSSAATRKVFWIARDVKGRFGGIFLFRYSALAFARRKSRPAGCATIYPSKRFELDLENRGNPLVRHLRPVIRLSRRPRRQLAGVIAKTKAAVKRRLKQLYAF